MPFVVIRNAAKRWNNLLPQQRTWAKLLVGFLIVLSCVWVFGELADEIREQEPILFDEPILRFMEANHSDWLTTLVRILTDFGGVIGVIVLVSAAAGLLWWRGRKRAVAILGFGVGGAALINVIAKAIFARARPDLWEHLVVETSYSFPSGHAMASSALAFCVMVIAWRTRWRWPAIILAALYMIIIGATRLYLGVHYPSDVVAGWAISLAWVILVAILLGIFRVRHKS